MNSEGFFSRMTHTNDIPNNSRNGQAGAKKKTGKTAPNGGVPCLFCPVFFVPEFLGITAIG